MRAALLGWLAYVVTYLLGWTTRIRIENPEVLEQIAAEGKHPLLAFWHGRQYFTFYPLRGRGFVVPASFHRDGEIVARLIGRMGHCIVRGSTTRGAVGLLIAMVHKVREGRGAAISVDGPRGPFRRAKSGILTVAQKTGNPVVPVAGGATHTWTSRRSWDRFMLPKPFSTVVLRFMPPITVPADTTREGMDAYLARLQSALEEGCRAVDTATRRPGLEERLIAEAATPADKDR
jgi:lysophospholipid acyltransferase (LPLAT)-like uncharacterized protein